MVCSDYSPHFCQVFSQEGKVVRASQLWSRRRCVFPHLTNGCTTGRPHNVCVCVTDCYFIVNVLDLPCYFIVNVLDLPFASPIVIYRYVCL